MGQKRDHRVGLLGAHGCGQHKACQNLGVLEPRQKGVAHNDQSARQADSRVDGIAHDRNLDHPRRRQAQGQRGRGAFAQGRVAGRSGQAAQIGQRQLADLHPCRLRQDGCRVADHGAGQPQDRDAGHQGQHRHDHHPAQPARMGAAPHQRDTDGVKGCDHVGIIDLKRFGRGAIVKAACRIEGGQVDGIQTLDRGQRPMGQGHAGARVRQQKRGIAQAHHDFAQLRCSRRPPQAGAFQPEVFLHSGHARGSVPGVMAQG